MRAKAAAAAAVAAALAVAALGIRGLRPAREAAPVPVPAVESSATGGSLSSQPALVKTSPAGAQAQAQPAVAAGFAKADLAKTDVVEEVVVPQKPQAQAPARREAPRPHLQPLRGVSNVLDEPARTGAMIAAGPQECPTCAAAQQAVMQAAQAMAGQAQAIALQAAAPARPAQPAPAAMTQQAVMLQLSPNSTLEEFRYSVVNLDPKAVNDVQIITPEKTWKLGTLGPGQSSEISSPTPLMQVKVHYVTSR